MKKKLSIKELKNVFGGVGGGTGSPDLPPRLAPLAPEDNYKKGLVKSGG